MGEEHSRLPGHREERRPVLPLEGETLSCGRQKRSFNFEVTSVPLVVPQVTVPGQVVDVACGVDHMVALVRSLL